MRTKLLSFLLVLLTSTITYANPAPTSDGFNSFSFDFYKKINTGANNIVVSPYSLASVLAVLSYGAAGDTRAQLEKTLHLNQQNLFAFNQALQQNSQLIIANALWAQQGLPYEPSFLEQIKTGHFYFFQLNFADGAAATAHINNWVAKQTKNKITHLIPAGLLNASTKLVLTNTIYFKDAWRYPFSANATKLMSFNSDNDSKTQVNMMQQQHEFIYNENKKLQLLQLPYANNNLAMLIILPRASLGSLNNTLNNDQFNALLNSAREQSVNVYLPKFKVSSTFPQLTDTLQSLGISDAFSARADFSNLTKQPIFLAAVIQKAIIEVDEQGTTAAAATAAVMERTAIMIPKEPKVFRADHPFVFIIYDTKARSILFMGKFVNNN